jgi:hypothetical protein
VAAKGTPQSRLPGVAVALESQPRKRCLNHTGATSLLTSQQQRATAVYNLATAAAAAGINKSTVLRHIKAGKVSATRDHNGGSGGRHRVSSCPDRAAACGPYDDAATLERRLTG